MKKEMKKLIATVLTVLLLSMGLGVSAVCASPGNWETNPDLNAEVSVTDDTITLGIANDPEGDHQPVAVHGATLELPPAEQIYVEYDCDLATWDSYNPVSVAGTGYWDSFSISVSQDEYWDLTLSDPINGDPLSLGFLWGGALFGDGVLDTTSGSAATTMTASTLSTNYLNVVLDTATLPANNGDYPSWGTCEITKVEILGVPSVTKELVDAWDENVDGDDIIDLGEKWYFVLRIDVTNNIDIPIDSVMVKDNLGGDLELNDYEICVGTVNSWTTGKTEKVHLTWEEIGTLYPGQTETMWLLVSTDINTGTGNGKNPGHQEYTSEGTHCLNSGATAKGLVELPSGVVWEVTDTTDEICVETGEAPPIND